MKIYAIEVLYGDGYSYSATALQLFHTDKEYLQDLCDTFTILDDCEDYSFNVITIDITSDNFSNKCIEDFKVYWGLRG